MLDIPGPAERFNAASGVQSREIVLGSAIDDCKKTISLAQEKPLIFVCNGLEWLRSYTAPKITIVWLQERLLVPWRRSRAVETGKAAGMCRGRLGSVPTILRLWIQ